MQNTRQKILDYLAANNKATTGELSRTFDMTQANIRHHLSLLVDQGHVEVVGQNSPDGRGRPTNLYMPAKKAQKHSIDLILCAFLDELQNRGTKKKREKRIRRLAESLASNKDSEDKSITLLLRDSIQHLNELNYQAHWEAHADSPIIFLGRCPYAPVIDEYPALCTMDKFLLEKMLGREVEQITKIARSPQGPLQCQFIILPENTEQI